MREVVELPMLHPEKFVTLGIDPPKGVLLYGPPGTGEFGCARVWWGWGLRVAPREICDPGH